MTKDIEKIGILFDLDGVLIDSEGLYSEFWASMDRMYPTGIENFAAYIKGTTLPSILSHFRPEQRDDVERRIHAYEDEIRYPIFPGVIEFLAELKGQGIPSAIVTSSDNVKMEVLFSQHPVLKTAVDVIITGSDVKKSKPDPEGYLTAAKAIGRLPENCFVFEDSLQGLEAGRRAGAVVVGIATTNPRSKVEPLSDITVDNFSDINLKRLLSYAANH